MEYAEPLINRPFCPDRAILVGFSGRFAHYLLSTFSGRHDGNLIGLTRRAVNHQNSLMTSAKCSVSMAHREEHLGFPAANRSNSDRATSLGLNGLRSEVLHVPSLDPVALRWLIRLSSGATVDLPRLVDNLPGCPQDAWITLEGLSTSSTAPSAIVISDAVVFAEKNSVRRPRVRFATVAVAFMLFVVAVQDAGVSRTPSCAEAFAGNTAIQSFNKAKTLMCEVFAGHGRTFYCDCAFSKDTVDLQLCGYQPQKNPKRAR